MQRYILFGRDLLSLFFGTSIFWFRRLRIPSWFGSYIARSLDKNFFVPGGSLDSAHINWDEGIDARSVLANRGIIVAHTDLDRSIASTSVKLVETLVGELESSDRTKKSASGKLGIAQPDVPYGKLAEAGHPIAVFREGVDQGMVDIFHADQLLPDLNSEVQRIVSEWGISEVIEAITGKKYRLRNFNIYLNRSVLATRAWHVDSYGSFQFKVFLYLTDVLDAGDGPYCYVPGTSSSKEFALANRVLARLRNTGDETDVTIFPSEDALMLLGSAGTLVVSNQSGAHRGFPQSPGRRRCIVALNLIPE